jgi:hypothetical protein
MKNEFRLILDNFEENCRAARARAQPLYNVVKEKRLTLFVSVTRVCEISP